MSNDFVFRGSVKDLDPDLYQLLERERIRQEKTIILIPSESAAPEAVEEAMGSKFGNIYAEGYPRESSRKQTEAEILDFERELAYYRRNSDPRYYKGVEYADVVEALCRRRAAELFAANGVSPDNMYVNVQALSGGPANSALYTAILKPGDTIMGLKLADGGHLSHGAPVNRSGSVYNAVSYIVDPEKESLDYEAIEAMAMEVKPNVIVAGFSAYPLIIDWHRFREIADKVGAHFHADIAHISGLVAAGVHPSPVGIADSVMTTTHKSLCGPRGAMLMTHRKDIGLKIDKAVFPGEQGGGHFNTIAALSLALKLAQTDQFKQLQLRIVQNASRLARRLSEHGLRIVGGKSENHLLLIDVRGSKNHYGVTLDGDSAARLLDVAGIVTNRNTIPGDKSALIPSGVRIGTVWISQLGYGDAEIDKLADAIAMLIVNAIPVEYSGKVRRRTRRAKVPWTVLQEARALVRELTGQTEEASDQQNTAVCIRGKNARPFLNQALASDVLSLMNEKSHASQLIIDENTVLPCTVYRDNLDRFHLHFENGQNAQSAHLFLQDLSDGYVLLANDPYAKLLGPVTVEIGQQVGRGDLDTVNGSSAGKTIAKPYFVGQGCLNGHNKTALPTFSYSPPAPNGLKKTALNAIHQLAGAKMIDFSGYEMPVWYSSVSDEHTAVRTGAALFDVSHMGIFTAAGPTAEAFLDMITTNDVSRLGIGRSLYCYMLDPEGNVIDDLMIYRQGEEFFILVVNAANIEKDWAWLNAVNSGEVLIDLERPWVKQPQPCVLEDARENGSWLLLALQGPKSKEVLIKAGANRDALDQLGWANQAAIQVGNDELIISRTGYTGERIGYEIFATPQNIDTLWQALTNSGATPAGLAARDSVRIEAGLPLYGQELAGPLSIDPDTACFGGFVKLWKPFFVGRAPFIKTFETHKNTIVRFQMDDKGVRRPTQGDPIIDGRGKVIGIVTSCGIDSDGHLTGMALVPLNMRRKGTKLMVYQTNGGQNAVAGPDAITIGSKLPKPDSATVLTRFPSKKRK